MFDGIVGVLEGESDVGDGTAGPEGAAAGDGEAGVGAISASCRRPSEIGGEQSRQYSRNHAPSR